MRFHKSNGLGAINLNRFVTKRTSYLPTKPDNEGEFENLVLSLSGDLFPYAHAVDWKPLAPTPTGEGTRPDMLLFAHDLSAWWIIEVEIIKNLSYSREHIAKQLAKQSRADWSKVRQKLIRPLTGLGYSTDDAHHLGTIEPGFLLICNGLDNTILTIASENNFNYMVAEPYVSDLGGYALDVTRKGIEISPPADGVFFDIGYHSGREPDLGGGWWVSIPPGVLDKFRSKDQILVEVDNQRFLSTIHHTASEYRIKIPLSLDPNSDSDRVIHKTADARFHLSLNDNIELLSMTIKRRYIDAEP